MKKLGIVIALAALAGCGADNEDIKKWMADNSKDMKIRIERIEEPKKFTPFKYEADKLVDPFNATKVTLVSEEKKSARGGGVGIKPDFDRPKEVLEAFPLENLKMVGMLKQKGAFFGVIKADANLHRVRVGNYMGQNFGIITGITESEITLKELVQDGGGDWVERVSTLQLQEVSK
jgi:type IV pilus assembly protein PilP